MRHPPRLASWLLRRFGSGPRREALAGDLIERYQARGSVLWYWRQVLSAILTGAAYDAQAHISLVARAVLLSWAATWVMGYATWLLFDQAGLWMWNWTVEHDWNALRVAWFGTPRWPSPLLRFTSCIYGVIIGWLVARFSGRHASATILACVVASMVWRVGGDVWFFGVEGLRGMIAFMPGSFFLGHTAASLSLLIGGIFGARSSLSVEQPLEQSTIGTET